MASRTTAAPASRTTGSASAPTPTSSVPLSSAAVPQEKIAMRAYEKWCQRGCPQGTAQQDWLEAEQELREEMSRGPKPQAQPTAQRR